MPSLSAEEQNAAWNEKEKALAHTIEHEEQGETRSGDSTNFARNCFGFEVPGLLARLQSAKRLHH